MYAVAIPKAKLKRFLTEICSAGNVTCNMESDGGLQGDSVLYRKTDGTYYLGLISYTQDTSRGKRTLTGS